MGAVFPWPKKLQATGLDSKEEGEEEEEGDNDDMHGWLDLRALA